MLKVETAVNGWDEWVCHFRNTIRGLDWSCDSSETRALRSSISLSKQSRCRASWLCMDVFVFCPVQACRHDRNGIPLYTQSTLSNRCGHRNCYADGASKVHINVTRTTQVIFRTDIWAVCVLQLHLCSQEFAHNSRLVQLGVGLFYSMYCASRWCRLAGLLFVSSHYTARQKARSHLATTAYCCTSGVVMRNDWWVQVAGVLTNLYTTYQVTTTYMQNYSGQHSVSICKNQSAGWIVVMYDTYDQGSPFCRCQQELQSMYTLVCTQYHNNDRLIVWASSWCTSQHACAAVLSLCAYGRWWPTAGTHVRQRW